MAEQGGLYRIQCFPNLALLFWGVPRIRIAPEDKTSSKRIWEKQGAHFLEAQTGATPAQND